MGLAGIGGGDGTGWTGFDLFCVWVVLWLGVNLIGLDFTWFDYTDLLFESVTSPYPSCPSVGRSLIISIIIRAGSWIATLPCSNRSTCLFGVVLCLIICIYLTFSFPPTLNPGCWDSSHLVKISSSANSRCLLISLLLSLLPPPLSLSPSPSLSLSLFLLCFRPLFLSRFLGFFARAVSILSERIWNKTTLL